MPTYIPVPSPQNVSGASPGWSALGVSTPDALTVQASGSFPIPVVGAVTSTGTVVDSTLAAIISAGAVTAAGTMVVPNVVTAAGTMVNSTLASIVYNGTVPIGGTIIDSTLSPAVTTVGAAPTFVINVQGAAGATSIPVTSTLVRKTVSTTILGNALYPQYYVLGMTGSTCDTTVAGIAKTPGGAFNMLSARMEKKSTQATGAQFRMHMFDGTAGIVPQVGNATANPTIDSNMSHYLGAVDFLNFQSSGTTSDTMWSTGQFQGGMASFMPGVCATGQTAISTRFETLLATYVATLWEKFTVDFVVEQF